MTLSTATSAFTWWIKTATPRCWACCGWNAARNRSRKLRSIRHYDGLPIDARSVTDEIASQEAAN